MKIFEVRYPSRRYYSWQFRCKVESCGTCKLRFLCFTTNKTVLIEDERLWDLLARISHTHSFTYEQRAVRKTFFKWMVRKGRKNDIGSIA